jgi:hypothetical protein
MQDFVYNDIKVYGRYDDLDRFEDEVSMVGESVFSFNKLVPKPEETSYMSDGILPGEYRWTVINWGTRSDCIGPELSHKRDHLAYHFTTINTAPYPVYKKIIETYKSLNFEIHVFDEVYLSKYEIAASCGEYNKFIFLDTGIAHWKNDLYIKFEYKKDFLNENKIEIIKAEIEDRKII